MIIHSIVSLEDILYEPSEKPVFTCVKTTDGYVTLRKNGDDYHVSSLFSTNPKAYLNKKYSINNKFV